MFVIRQALPHDLDDLHSLAKQTFFINLPADRDIIAQKIEQSQRSFQSLTAGRIASTIVKGASSRANAKPTSRATSSSGIKSITGGSPLFMFVLEDVEGRGVIGTSQVIARMGGPRKPRVFLQLSTMRRESESLKVSWEHKIARLQTDETGPTEIGGIILNHAFRGHKLRLGRLLSFVRFHLIGLFREQFADRVVAEMLGPIDRNGYNPFFEKFTRHFIPRSFAEVYKFSQTSKEFVEGLLPPGDIDISIMDPEAANSAGAVSEETRPARAILESLGFKYLSRIDPMDGGPHLEAPTADISLVKATRRAKSLHSGLKNPRSAGTVIISTINANGDFHALQAPGEIERTGLVRVREDARRLLQPEGAKVIGVTPVE